MLFLLDYKFGAALHCRRQRVHVVYYNSCLFSVLAVEVKISITSVFVPFFFFFCSELVSTKYWSEFRFSARLCLGVIRSIEKWQHCYYQYVFQTCMLECYGTEYASMTRTYLWNLRNHSVCSSSF
jgi:hypothetical protein